MSLTTIGEKKYRKKKPSAAIDIKPFTVPRHKPDLIWDKTNKKYIVPDYSESQIEIEERKRREKDVNISKQNEEAKEQWEAEQERRRKMSLPLC